MARPTKLTDENAEKIITAIRAGSYPLVAARLAGIGESTFYRWLKDGKDDPEGNPREAKFRQDVRDAEAAAEVANVALIRQAATGGVWTAAAWWLERKFPERWGRRVQADVYASATPAVSNRERVLELLDRYARPDQQLALEPGRDGDHGPDDLFVE